MGMESAYTQIIVQRLMQPSLQQGSTALAMSASSPSNSYLMFNNNTFTYKRIIKVV